jgi:hypothetical protein
MQATGLILDGIGGRAFPRTEVQGYKILDGIGGQK